MLVKPNRGSMALDVGCGIGSVTEELGKLGFVGDIDMSARMVGMSRQRDKQSIIYNGSLINY